MSGPEKRRWLVTGGCGFIGRNLVHKLAARGDAIRVLDDLSVGRRDGLAAVARDVELIVGDIRDAAAVGRAVAGVDAVVHLAAQTGVGPSLDDPAADLDRNVVGTERVLAAARAAGVRRFVFASSNAALGDQEMPLHEGQAPRPRSPYGASKLAGEGLCSAYAASFGLGTVALRFANVYGPGSEHKTSVIARCLRRARAGEPLIVHGDGLQTRDFVHVDDLCDAIIAAAASALAGEVLHIGSGQETPIGELVAAIAAMAQPDVDHQIAVERRPAPAGEIRRSVSAITRAASLLGYRPRVGLTDGLLAAWRASAP